MDRSRLCLVSPPSANTIITHKYTASLSTPSPSASLSTPSPSASLSTPSPSASPLSSLSHSLHPLLYPLIVPVILFLSLTLFSCPSFSLSSSLSISLSSLRMKNFLLNLAMCFKKCHSLHTLAGVSPPISLLEDMAYLQKYTVNCLFVQLYQGGPKSAECI